MEKISFDDWKKLDLRVGKIKSVKDHPNADKLYVLIIDLGKGEHNMQIVSGLREHYKEEELLGKEIVVICNLEHTIIRGVESQGMLLAAVFKNKVVLVRPDKEIAAGAKVE